jgi:hypothetical protein
MASIRIGGQGIPLNLLGQSSNDLSLAAGAIWTIPSGQWFLNPGFYTIIQNLDPISGLWLDVGAGADAGPVYVESDGYNYRLANLTGCMIGAVVTNAGTGYTSAPTVTASAGGSTWKAIVGGLISTTVTVNSGGTNYLLPPTVVIAAPPLGGVQATATATISAGAVTAVTITNQGAGYTSAPAITFLPNPVDLNNPVYNSATTTPITTATATATVTGSGTIAAVLCTGPGTPQTSLPTLTFAGGGGASAAATAVGNFVTTGYTVTTGGTGFTAGTLVTTSGGLTAATPTHTNPQIEQGLTDVRPAWIQAALNSGAITATGQIITNNGYGFQAVPSAVAISANGLPTGGATLVMSVGGITDTSYIQPI